MYISHSIDTIMSYSIHLIYKAVATGQVGPVLAGPTFRLSELGRCGNMPSIGGCGYIGDVMT